MDGSGLLFVVVVGMISQGLSQSTTNLLCYDCDPQKNGQQCLDPVRSGIQQTNCDQKFSDRSPNATILCLSANITFFGDQSNNTGIYRGCQLQEPSVTSFCDWYKQELDNNNTLLVSCVECNSTRCNNVTFNQVGQPNNKGTSLINIALTVVVVSFLFGALF